MRMSATSGMQSDFAGTPCGGGLFDLKKNKKSNDGSVSSLDARQHRRATVVRTAGARQKRRAGARDPDRKDLFFSLIKVLHSVLDFDDAFVLNMLDNQRMQAMLSTADRLKGTYWEPGSVFKEVLGGRPVAVSNIQALTEWAGQTETIKANIASALHISLYGGRLAILVITHSQPGYFRSKHIRLLSTFAPLAAQAFLSLDLQKEVVQRDRFFQLAMDLMGIIDYSGKFKQLNNSWSLYLGYLAEEFYRHDLFTFIHAEDVRIFTEALRRLKRTGEQCLVEARFRRFDGSYVWLSCSLAVYHDERLCYIVARDVTDRVLIETRLAYDARHDSLTGLYNRVEFMERLDMAFARSVRESRYAFALFYMDLNGFKMVNDKLGHSIGDLLLKEVSRCLIDVVRGIDTVSRFGGDEFTILLDAITSQDQVLMVINRVHEKLHRPFILSGLSVQTSVSIGVALSSPAYESAEQMLRDADAAMYEAKSASNLSYVLIKKNGPAHSPRRRKVKS